MKGYVLLLFCNYFIADAVLHYEILINLGFSTLDMWSCHYIPLSDQREGWSIWLSIIFLVLHISDSNIFQFILKYTFLERIGLENYWKNVISNIHIEASLREKNRIYETEEIEYKWRYMNIIQTGNKLIKSK